MTNQLAAGKPKADDINWISSDPPRVTSSARRGLGHQMTASASLAAEMISLLFEPASKDTEDIVHATAGPAREYGFMTPVPHPCSILREKQVTIVTGLSRSSVWAYCNPENRYYDPTFPKPVKLGVRAVGWRASEIFLWVASRHSRT